MMMRFAVRPESPFREDAGPDAAEGWNEPVRAGEERGYGCLRDLRMCG